MYIDEEFLRPREVAELLHVSKKTVYRWIEEGLIDFFHPSEKVYLIAKSALYSLLESKKNI